MLEILQNKKQIRGARESLYSLNRSVLHTQLAKLIHRLRFTRQLPVGDMVKSWDVSQTLDFIDRELSKDAAILDLGAY